MGDHIRDTQSAAFRGATAADWVDDDEMARLFEQGALVVATGPIKTVEEHEAEGWDAGRIGPKSFEDAKAALFGRVSDPSAPDDNPDAYAELHPDDYPGGR